MPANPLSAQPAATSKPELTPTHPHFMSPVCVFPICFCVFQCRYCSSRGQGTDRLEAIFWDQFLLFVDFRATRHVIIVVPTPRIARCQFAPAKLMIYYWPIKMYLIIYSGAFDITIIIFIVNVEKTNTQNILHFCLLFISNSLFMSSFASRKWRV